MSSEVHVVVANDRIQALTRIAILVAGRHFKLLSSGFRSRVTFENLDDGSSGHDASSDQQLLYCVVARVDD